MSNLEAIPGLTLYLDTAELHDKSGKLVLRASVNDRKVWDEVVEKIDGHRIYTADNVAQLAVSLLEENLSSKDKELKELREWFHERLESLESTNSELRAQETEWAEEVSKLSRELEETKIKLNEMRSLAEQWQKYAQSIQHGHRR